MSQKIAYTKLENIIELRGNYKSGTVPDKVLFLTAAIDVRRGSPNDPDNQPRLEMEVKGHGASYRTWSIIYKVFYGDVDIPLNGAWRELDEYKQKTKLIYKRKDGFQFRPVLIFINSGDKTIVNAVCRFAEIWNNTYPVSGFQRLRKRKNEISDDGMINANLKRFRLIYLLEALSYEVNANYYQHELYNSLTIERKEFGAQSPGFCDFPQDYPEKYFKMLTAEEKLSNGAFKNRGGQDEALYLDIYNRCARDVYLNRMKEFFRTISKKFYTAEGLQGFINNQYVLKYLAQEVGIKYE